MKKTALLHYWLTGMRGGEMVLSQFCNLLPDADVFTHALLKNRISSDITSHQIRESFIARLPFGRSHCQKYLPLMPQALKGWNLTNYDLIISSESGPVKGIRKRQDACHICYCHTPMRYLWDMYDFYYNSTGIGGKIAMRLFKESLRHYDLMSAECVDEFIANSEFVAERIKRIYGRESTVIHPPVDVDYFSNGPELERKFYLLAGQLVSYKRPDLVIEAFRKLPNQKLVVVGNGPMKKSLQKKAPANVSFVTSENRESMRELYSSAKALLFPGIEDFGIVPVEAQAAGCPVVALNFGGTAETVVDGVNGTHLQEQSVSALLEAIEKNASGKWNKAVMLQYAEKFSVARFQKQIKNFISSHAEICF